MTKQNPPTVSQVDQKLAAAAYAKVARREPLTGREQTALRRFEKEREEQLRWKYYESIPQKHWRQMSGRQTKVLHEQAERYSLPFGGAVVNLPQLARALHDFLAANAKRLNMDETALLTGGNSPALEAYRQERAALTRLDRLQREGQLLPRDQVREALGRIAGTLRAAGAALDRQFGPEALDLLLEALDDAEAEVARCFDRTDDDSQPTPTDGRP